MADSSSNSTPDQVRLSRNPRLFILFRIFLNSRFYYPVYALLFLDFGLSLEQFAALNFAWAVSIVLLEIPSGALADQFGRRPLVITAAILMMIEMSIMIMMPVIDRSKFAGNPEELNHAVWILFVVFMINRVISGAAEAAASGADEALAYDSLPEKDRDSHWRKLTTQLMIWQSIAFIVITLIGAAAYDPVSVNMTLKWFGFPANFVQAETLKFPIALTLGMSVAALFIALRMKEPPGFHVPTDLSLAQSIRASFRRTFQAGAWILKTPAALMLLLVGLSFDSIIRLYYTVGSIWMEVIGFQRFQMGYISVAGSIAGIIAALIGARLIHKHSPNFNFRLLEILIFIGIFSLAFPIRYWSVLFLPALWISMRLLHFFLSNYLNRVTDSKNRATVLSFRGLTMNLSYGIITCFYGWQTAILRKRHHAGGGEAPDEHGDALTHQIFTDATQWWWVYLLVIIGALTIFQKFKIGKTWNELLPPEDTDDERVSL